MKKKQLLIFLMICITLIIIGCEKSEIPSDTTNQTEVNSEATDVGKQSEGKAENTLSNEEVTVPSESIKAEENEKINEESKEEVTKEPQDEEDSNTVADTSVNTQANENTAQAERSVDMSFSDVSFSFDEDKIARSVELGFSSPLETEEEIEYSSASEDVIKFDSSKKGIEFYKSITHSGFAGLEISYSRHQYQWDDFFGDLDYTEYERNIDVSLKGDSIYEADVVDDYEKYFRYYDENEGIYYEVSELMMGNFTDPNTELTKKVLGKSCLYKGILEFTPPTYNPFILQKDERVSKCFTTSYNDEPAIYIETVRNEKLCKKWISIKYGVIIKELIFDSDGLVADSKVATVITKNSINDNVFVKPSDVEFKDITVFIFSLEGGDIETLVEAVDNTIPENEFSMILKNSLGGELIIHAGGLDDMALDQPIYISKVMDLEGNELTLISYRYAGFYHTICPELKTVEKYQTSCFESKFFDFETVGLSSVKEDEATKKYTFYNNDKGSVSGMIKFYEYEVDKEKNKISSLKVYNKNSLSDSEVVGEIIEYEIVEFGEADESLVEIPEDYKIIDHGENSHNDGEHIPFWYE